MEKQVDNIIKEFFEKLQIQIDNIEISVEEETIYNVKIETPDSGVLIGPHGKNIDAIQSILRLIVSKALDTKASLHLEINDYMKSKDERLFDFIKSKISFVEKSGKDIRLPFLNSYERKKVHSFVAELNNSKISTKSMGEGKERRLFICKEAEKLSIDIDGDDI